MYKNKKEVLVIWKYMTFVNSPFSGIFALTGEGAANNTVSVEQIIGIFSKVTEQFSVSNIIALLGGIIAFCMAFVFLWWGVRKGFSAAMRAIKSGKFRL